MFSVVYQFDVKENREAEFEKHWHDATRLIHLEKRSLGSRLHRASNGSYVAYAQWPSRQQWAEQTLSSEKLKEALQKMRDCTSKIEVKFELEVVDDHLAK